MNNYTYAFRFVFKDTEVFFSFLRFPDLLTWLPLDQFSAMKPEEIQAYAADALICTLQTRMSIRGEIPQGDDPRVVKADGFVALSVQQAMKLELYSLLRANRQSLGKLASQIGRKQTAVRRMLNLRHSSVASEIELAIESFGKRLVHSWGVELGSSSQCSGRVVLSSIKARSLENV